MKIALIGYGKMGKAIEEKAIHEGDEIVLKITSKNKNLFSEDTIKNADVAIEFTNPQSAVENIRKCLNADVPVISGTTGWLKQMDALKEYCIQKNGAFLYASNFSVGVNIFFALNKFLAALMNGHENYNVSMEETHHIHKKDAPSGTAITLAEQILEKIKTKKSWVDYPAKDSSDLEITSRRIDEIPGIHKIKYNSPEDVIEITHSAHNRGGFASGALLAAKFLVNKKGIFTMQDVLGV